MKKNVAAFLILILPFILSWKSSTSSSNSFKKNNISILRINDKLLIRKETNGKIELVEKIEDKNYTLLPFENENHSLSLRLVPKKSKDDVFIKYIIHYDRFLGNPSAENNCGEPLTVRLKDVSGHLFVEIMGYQTNSSEIYVSLPEDIEYLDCWKELDPNDTIEKVYL